VYDKEQRLDYQSDVKIKENLHLDGSAGCLEYLTIGICTFLLIINEK
jgi:hypothetical protein